MLIVIKSVVFFPEKNAIKHEALLNIYRKKINVGKTSCQGGLVSKGSQRKDVLQHNKNEKARGVREGVALQLSLLYGCYQEEEDESYKTREHPISLEREMICNDRPPLTVRVNPKNSQLFPTKTKKNRI